MFIYAQCSSAIKCHVMILFPFQELYRRKRFNYAHRSIMNSFEHFVFDDKEYKWLGLLQ